MLFNSFLFMGAYLPATLMGFALARRIGAAAGSTWLILASLTFYGWAHAGFLPVLLCSVLGNFVIACAIVRYDGPERSAIVASGIVLNLAALAWYKYLAVTLRAFGVDFPDQDLPLGISFFTFTQIGYLLDCGASLTRPRGLLNYLTFTTFFPHLTSGPILNGREVEASFPPPPLIAANVIIGLGMFLIGLMKKTLLADPIASMVAPGFSDGAALMVFASWRSALAWSLQLYFDFSGYSDMAVGLARMFGVNFPWNFNAPYTARNVIDYWQRWHMSLTRFLTNTIHAPLSLMLMRRRHARGDRRGARSLGGFAVLVALPVSLTMLAAGIWHGAAWTFVVFGVLHGGFLIVNHAWRLWAPMRLPAVVSVAITYVCVLSAAVIFRAPSLDVAGTLLGGMIGWHGIETAIDPRALLDAAWLAGEFLIVWCAPTTQTITSERVMTFSPQWAIGYGIAAAVGILSLGGTGEFLYFQF